MSFLLSMALGGFNWLKGLPWQIYAGLAVIAICGLSYCAGERNGKADERAKWEDRVAEIRAERDDAMVRAAQADEDVMEAIGQSIKTNRKELDDAVKDLPDQELSARQCARVAAQLRREGRGSELSPACTDLLDAGASE